MVLVVSTPFTVIVIVVLEHEPSPKSIEILSVRYTVSTTPLTGAFLRSSQARFSRRGVVVL